MKGLPADQQVHIIVFGEQQDMLADQLDGGAGADQLPDVMQVQIPPLRERREDIRVLSEYYLEYFNRKFKRERLVDIGAFKPVDLRLQVDRAFREVFERKCARGADLRPACTSFCFFCSKSLYFLRRKMV